MLAIVELNDALIAGVAIAGLVTIILGFVLGWHRSDKRAEAAAKISSARSIIRGMRSGVIPSGLGTISTSAPKASIVRSFSAANASDETMRSG